MSLQGFNSIEEVLRYIDQQQAAASAATPPQLREMVTWGGFVIAPVPDMGLIIFGDLHSIEDLERTEDEETVEDFKAAYRNDRRYGKWYSIIEPKGEYGSHHVVDCYPITHEQFQQAESVEWVPQKMPWLRAVVVEAIEMHNKHEGN